MTDQDNKSLTNQSEYLVDVKNLKKYYPVQTGFFAQLFSKEKDFVRAVDDVTFQIKRGEVLDSQRKR